MASNLENLPKYKSVSVYVFKLKDFRKRKLKIYWVCKKLCPYKKSCGKLDDNNISTYCSLMNRDLDLFNDHDYLIYYPILKFRKNERKGN